MGGCTVAAVIMTHGAEVQVVRAAIDRGIQRSVFHHRTLQSFRVRSRAHCRQVKDLVNVE